MPNTWSDEAPQQRESRLAMSACMNADVAFRGVRDGLCYFEVYLTDDLDGPGVVLSLPADGLTAEKIAQSCRRGGMEQAEGKMKSGAVETTAPPMATAPLPTASAGDLREAAARETLSDGAALSSSSPAVTPLAQ